ncbi:TRAP transporter substrate-binding protein [Thalassospira sp. GB04J01]|jgi:C4-dicarboxylate-binding protein DctP|uniref:TRAP transporter substrate-binding protein n=1 Tax=Thalassospira sp. GB04J01 TaxID=1485225 RepID=UPI000C9A1D95|nr:TRAP transporter substrate-binding protein [Thalassospira sp. GB04J01]|tara:strand:+ start:204 stop:1196 length:993 start_codon:yes stop_codon:yes gene_type:complete
MRLISKKILAASVATAAILGMNGMASAQEVIKFAHVVAPNTPKGKGAEFFKKRAEELLGDKVKIEIYPNSQLFDDSKVLAAILRGDVQFGAPSLAKFGKWTKKLQVYDLPFLFKDMDAVSCFQNGEKGQELLGAMSDKGLTGVGYWHNGLKQLSANKPLNNPADAEGLKFRIQSSDVIAAQFEAVDAVPQKMAFSETYSALQTGVVDGQENTWSNIYSKKFFEVQDYITESNHGLLDYMVVTSTKWWDGLDPEIRDGLTQAMNEASDYANSLSAELTAEQRQAVIDSGETEVQQLSGDDFSAWQNAVKPVWAEFSDDIGQDIIDAAAACN